MIQNTFAMLYGVGEKTERNLWKHNILTWDDFLSFPHIEGISQIRKKLYDANLLDAIQAIQSDNIAYFAHHLKRRDQWRMYEHCASDVVCMDIETNGLQVNYGGYVTVVGIFDGFDFKTFVRGENLTVQNLIDALKGYKCLITFNGALFDIPFLKRSFTKLKIDIPHFDICLCSRQIGINMGLKKMEIEFNIKRDETVQGLTGYDAVKLWRYAEAGSQEALQILIKYNAEDTKSLFKLAPIIYEKLKASTGINEYLIER